jgi:cell division septation protein DedD
MLPGMDCCDPNGLNRVFAGPVVQRELRAFKRKGLNRRQRKIVEVLEPSVGSSGAC